jgi:hypothetical protein
MDNSKSKKCPYCGSLAERPANIEIRYGSKYEYPTTFVCQTVTSPNWSPPIKGKECKG